MCANPACEAHGILFGGLGFPGWPYLLEGVIFVILYPSETTFRDTTVVLLLASPGCYPTWMWVQYLPHMLTFGWGLYQGSVLLSWYLVPLPPSRPCADISPFLLFPVGLLPLAQLPWGNPFMGDKFTINFPWASDHVCEKAVSLFKELLIQLRR